MNIGMVGLGKMGSNMARRLMRGGHQCFVYDVNSTHVRQMVDEGAKGYQSLKALVQGMPKPRYVWMMLPSGEVTESMVMQLKDLLEWNDVVIDGGNSHFKDAVRREEIFETKGVQFLDVGTSGGVWGLERGYCLMIGGDGKTFLELEPLFITLAPGSSPDASVVQRTSGRKKMTTVESGYLHCGPVGSGHFVKMIHNGIEYGMMQSLAEGLDILKGASQEKVPTSHRYLLNLTEIVEVWRRGSVISSWLLDLLAISLNQDPQLSRYVGEVQDSGEGRWTVQAAVDESVPADVISAALFARFRSRREHTFGEKVLSAMRNEFGGHVENNDGDNLKAEKKFG